MGKMNPCAMTALYMKSHHGRYDDRAFAKQVPTAWPYDCYHCSCCFLFTVNGGWLKGCPTTMEFSSVLTTLAVQCQLYLTQKPRLVVARVPNPGQHKAAETTFGSPICICIHFELLLQSTTYSPHCVATCKFTGSYTQVGLTFGCSLFRHTCTYNELSWYNTILHCIIPTLYLVTPLIILTNTRE